MRLALKLFLTICACYGSLFAQKTSRAEKLHCPAHQQLEREEKFGEFTVKTYRGNELDSCAVVLRNGKLVFSRYAEGKFVIGNDVNEGNGPASPPVIPIGTDITGRAKPDLLLVQWSGGAHCCFTFHVIELGNAVKEIAQIEAEDSDYAHFTDLNHDGRYEFIGNDYAFAYWRTSFAQSPAPGIILRFNGKGYELDLDLMRKRSPSAEELEQEADEVRTQEWPNGSPPPDLWGTMLDLIYAGNSDRAWQFLSYAWKPNRQLSKGAFLRSFCNQLATSRYFSQLRPTIKSPPCAFPKTANRHE